MPHPQQQKQRTLPSYAELIFLKSNMTMPPTPAQHEIQLIKQRTADELHQAFKFFEAALSNVRAWIGGA
jgi:hypothetical protein